MLCTSMDVATRLDGRYRLGELLGRGGMADVYRAVDEVDGRPVAVKLVRSSDPLLAHRLAHEARAMGAVDHPGLVRMLNSGLSDNHAFLVLDLVEGETLADSVGRGPLPPATVAAVGSAVAGALACVHSHGIVHRDVKPGNVLLGADGRPRLADFGVARLADSSSTLTVAGTTLGTAAYMAPEQLEDHDVGPAADVWALGMVLLECLLGRRIYEGTATEVVSRRLAGPVPMPGDLPAAWRHLLGTMLHDQPSRRPPAAVVAAMLAAPSFSTP